MKKFWQTATTSSEGFTEKVGILGSCFSQVSFLIQVIIFGKLSEINILRTSFFKLLKQF